MVKSVSILRESKTDSRGREVENRVILTPPLVRQLKCEVFVEKGAGEKIDFPDQDYISAGARICTHDEALQKDLILGVKETKQADFPKLHDNIFMSYQHFAQSRDRTMSALKTPATFVALETMEAKKDGYPFFPCLAPMSEAAAKVVARHADEYALLKKHIITSGLPETGLHGVKVAIFGAGSAGKTAAEEFAERGCDVFLLDKNQARVNTLVEYFHNNRERYPKVSVADITETNIRSAIKGSLFLVSSMYTAGKQPEKMVTKELLKLMVPGGCVYPIDIDQGGGIEGVSETSILDPFDLKTIPGTEVFFFAPPNLPSMGARTTSEALGTVILPYVKEIISQGLDRAANDNPIINSGINIQSGRIVHPGLAEVFPKLY